MTRWSEGGWKTGWQKRVEGMEEAPENRKELSHSAHGNGMNEWIPLRQHTKQRGGVVRILLQIMDTQRLNLNQDTSFITVWANYQDKTVSFHISHNSSFIYSPPANESLPNKLIIYNIPQPYDYIIQFLMAASLLSDLHLRWHFYRSISELPSLLTYSMENIALKKLDTQHTKSIINTHKICTIKPKGVYTLVTLPRTVTPYRDSVDRTWDYITYRKLVTR